MPLFTSDPRAVLEAASKYTLPEDAPAVILERSVTADIDEAGRLHKTTRTVTKVLRVHAIDPIQRLGIGWSILREDRPVIKARVITSDGQAHVLDPSNIVERDPSNPNEVGVIKILALVLPDVDIESVVELEIQENDREPAVPGMRLASIELQLGLPIAHFKASISSKGPSDLHVETRSFSAAKITPVSAAKGHAFSVEVFRFQPLSVGDFVPSDVSPVPAIVFTNVTSWQAVAAWYAETVKKALGISPAKSATAAETRLEAVEKIYEDLRKHMEDSALDLSVTSVAPRPPADILKSGTGNSRDEAVLLIGKLAEAGIPAHLALVSSAPAPDVMPALPGFEAFNHALVYVPGPTPLWIDPAAQYTPVSHLPIASQNRWALVVDPASTQLVRTSGSSEKDNVENASTEIHVGDGFPTKVSERVEASGAFGETLRSLIDQLPKADERGKNAMVTRIFQGVGGQRVESVKSSDARSLLGKAWLEMSGEDYAPSAIADDTGYIDLPGVAHLNFQGVRPLLAINRDDSSASFTEGRKVDYQVATPFTSEDSFRVIPPRGYRLKDVAAIPPITLGPLSITSIVKTETDGSLQLSYKMTQTKTRLTPQEVDGMRTASRQLAARNYLRVEFENVATAKMKSGDLAGGLQLLKQDAEAAKDSVNPSLRLASGYVQVGARDAGLALCKELLKKAEKPKAGFSAQRGGDPNLAAIYGRLGWIYERDAFGRLMAPGFDVAEAEKSLQESANFGNGAAMLQLADLYSYNAAGIRYGRSARLNEAIDILNRVDVNLLVREGRLNDYALLLLHGHRYNDLRELFTLPQGDAADQSINWATWAASRSEADLKDELTFRYPATNQRRILLVEAGRRLIAAREYVGALHAFKLAGVGPGVSQADLDRLGKVRVFDDRALSKDLSVAAFQKYVQAVLNPESADEWKKFVVAEKQSSTLQIQRKLLLQYLSRLMPGVANPQFWPYLSDFVGTAVSLTADGKDLVGFRVKASVSAAGPPTTVAFVVKEGDEYLVVGTANSNATSVQAVHAARAGNLPTARQWLDWGREAANRPNLGDAELQSALDAVSAQVLFLEGKQDEATKVLQRLHEQNPSDNGSTFALADSLIRNNRISDAKPYIDSLASSNSTNALALRLRAHGLAQQGNYSEAAALEKQLCARPDAAAADWNDVAWNLSFMGQNAAESLAAAEKAAELSSFGSAPILHTLAIAQTGARRLKEAIATGYAFQDLSGDEGELLTIFGRIAEQLALTDVAREYYSKVPKDPGGGALSNYAFAKRRLAALQVNVESPALSKKTSDF